MLRVGSGVANGLSRRVFLGNVGLRVAGSEKVRWICLGNLERRADRGVHMGQVAGMGLQMNLEEVMLMCGVFGREVEEEEKQVMVFEMSSVLKKRKKKMNKHKLRKRRRKDRFKNK